MLDELFAMFSEPIASMIYRFVPRPEYLKELTNADEVYTCKACDLAFFASSRSFMAVKVGRLPVYWCAPCVNNPLMRARIASQKAQWLAHGVACRPMALPNFIERDVFLNIDRPLEAHHTIVYPSSRRRRHEVDVREMALVFGQNLLKWSLWLRPACPPFDVVMNFMSEIAPFLSGMEEVLAENNRYYDIGDAKAKLAESCIEAFQAKSENKFPEGSYERLFVSAQINKFQASLSSLTKKLRRAKKAEMKEACTWQRQLYELIRVPNLDPEVLLQKCLDVQSFLDYMKVNPYSSCTPREVLWQKLRKTVHAAMEHVKAAEASELSSRKRARRG